MSNNLYIIYGEKKDEYTNVNTHYNEDERPTEGSIAFFTVYETVTYLGWGEEGTQIPYDEYEPLYTVPFIYNKETTDLMIKSQENRIKSLMADREIFVGVETHYKQMKEI